jgi:hypothetical protein
LELAVGRHTIPCVRFLSGPPRPAEIPFVQLSEGWVIRLNLDELKKTRAALEKGRSLPPQGFDLSGILYRLDQELAYRSSVIQQVGYDRPFLRSHLVTWQPVAMPLAPRPDEQCFACLRADLCRYTTSSRTVGRSSSVSIPLGHGFRYRVGGSSGYRIREEHLTVVDRGSLVITNARIAFVGAKRATSTDLAKLISVQPHGNGIEVFRQGKESADIFRTNSDEVVFALMLASEKASWDLERQLAAAPHKRLTRTSSHLADEIRSLDQLRVDGLISNEEFEARKRRLLES